MTVQLEHANMAVRDLDEAIRFFRTAFPEFAIRGRAVTDHGDFQSEWVHIGTEDTYVCLNADTKAVGDRERGHQGYGVNHIGFVVDDAKAVRQRMSQAGYKAGADVEERPYRHRVYFRDGDGNEFEFVEYFSDDPADRNNYD